MTILCSKNHSERALEFSISKRISSGDNCHPVYISTSIFFLPFFICILYPCLLFLRIIPPSQVNEPPIPSLLISAQSPYHKLPM